MEILVDDDELQRIEARAAAAHGAGRLGPTLALAWHLRQRDTGRAMALADDAEQMLGATPDAAAIARIALIRAETRHLFAELEAATPLAARALDGFTTAGDAAGACDAWWLLSRLAADRGDTRERSDALAHAARCAGDCGDARRAAFIDGLVACHALFDDVDEAEATWGDAMAGRLHDHPAIAAWACDFQACIALDRSDHRRAIGWLRDALDAARSSGQIKKAIATAANIGMAFARLNDHGAALEWAEQALDLARRAGWPASVGVSLMQTAASLEELERPDAAADMVAEALVVLAPLTGSFNYLMALVREGELALKRGRPEAALAAYAELDERTRAGHRLNFSVSVLLGRARAEALLGRAASAADAAREALAIAAHGKHANYQIDALRVLAGLHARFDDLPTPAGTVGPRAALEYLDRAFDIASGLAGYTLPADLLAFAADQQARAGDHARAYALALQSSAARAATHGAEARNRAIAMQVRHDTERARADAEHHRRLAVAETERAEALAETLAARERLNAERDETLAFLAHDLRVPLAAIVAMLPASGGALASDVDGAMLQRAARFAGRALALTDRFLAMARLARLPPEARERFDLADVVDEACETFLLRAHDEGKTLDTALVFGVAIEGAHEALMRALCNLVDNALRHTPRGGCVKVGMTRDGAAVEVAVADQGPGMPAAAEAVLCGNAGEGGSARGRLGLAIVAEVARLHGAAVRVAASPAGSVVRLRFAVAE